MNRQEDFINSLTDRHIAADEENAWHRQAGGDSGIGERGNRLAIVCQQYQAVRRRPSEHRGIGRCRQTNVANMGKLQRGIAAGQAVHDVLIEVLVDQKRDHGISPFALARANSSSLVGPGR